MNIAQALRAMIEHVDATAHLTGGAYAADEARAALAAHDAAVSAGDWEAFPQAADPSRFSIVCGHDVRARAYGANTAARIVACVNACTGIADPGALVAAARDALALADARERSLGELSDEYAKVQATLRDALRGAA